MVQGSAGVAASANWFAGRLLTLGCRERREFRGEEVEYPLVTVLPEDVIDHLGSIFAIEQIAKKVKRLLLDRNIVTSGLQVRIFFKFPDSVKMFPCVER